MKLLHSWQTAWNRKLLQSSNPPDCLGNAEGFHRRSISRVLYLYGHLSREPVARLLKRSFPEGPRAASTPPYSTLLPMGFTWQMCLHTSGALLPHHFTVACEQAVSFLWHFPSGCPARTLSGIVPYGARTFLYGVFSLEQAQFTTIAATTRPPALYYTSSRGIGQITLNKNKNSLMRIYVMIILTVRVFA